MPTKTKKTKKTEPVDVETIAVETVDHAYAIVTLNDTQLKLYPDQIHNLRRKLNAAFVELG